MRTDTSLREIEPVKKAELLEGLITSLTKGIFLMVFFGLATFVITQSLLIALVIALTIVLVLEGGKLWMLNKRIDNKEYRLYADRVESETGVLSTNIRDVQYDDITDVTRKQSFIEGKFGLGRVKVSTAGQSGSAITMKDIANHEEIYDTIREKAAQ